jgi:hypothetical protein
LEIIHPINLEKTDCQGTGLPFSCFFFLTFFLFCSLSGHSSERVSDDQISVSFVRQRIELPEATTFFNVVKIENRGTNAFRGFFRVISPDGWNIIGGTSREITVSPGSELAIPLRFSMSGNIRGDVTYVVSAEVQSEQFYGFATSYVSIEPVSDWDMRVNTSELFISESRPIGDFLVRLVNRGNVDELIRMDMDIGGLVSLGSDLDNTGLLFVDLPAYADTTVRFFVSLRKDIPWSEQQVMKRNWRESTVYLQATAAEKTLYAGIRVTELSSSYYNETPYHNSPLNADLSFFNLLSYQKPKMSGKVHGRLQFPNERGMNYYFGFNNIYFNKESNRSFDLLRNFRYRVNYADRNTTARFSDRISTGQLHSLSGTGISATQKIGSSSLSMGASYNPFGDNYGIHAGLTSLLGRISANAGATIESTRDSQFNHYSLHLGSTAGFRGGHSIRVQTVGSMSRFSQHAYSTADTSALGFAYRIGYQLRRSRYSLRLDNLNTRYSYLRNSGINRIDGNFYYLFNDKLRLHSYYNRNSYITSRYPYNFYFPGNKNLNENARIFLAYSRGNIIYQAGPQYISTIRNNFNPVTGVLNRYEYFQPGFVASATFRLGPFRSLTPNISFNAMDFSYSSSSAGDDGAGSSRGWQYTAGLNYYSRELKVSAIYSSGESSEIYRSAVVTGDPVISQAFHIRPYYERYINRERIRLNGYLNYSYYMPSQRENVILNLASDFFFGKGRSIFTSFNIYRTTRMDPQAGSITNRSINVMVGLRIAFDVQQFNYKHHDLRLVGFNDRDGNGLKNADERPVGDILVNISRDPLKNEGIKTGFSEINLLTDPMGEVFYGKIPEGVYDLSLTPLSSLDERYFLHGEKQILEIKRDTLYHLPLIESNSIRGKIIMDRDPNSNEGRISLEGVRISATSEKGDTYTTLTSANGSFILNVPRGTRYKVSIYNVFGEQFMLERGEFEVEFGENRIIELEFVFREIRRGIQFREGEELFRFNIKRD